MAKINMLDEVVRVPFEKLDEMNGNPRKMTAQDREDLEQSIKEFGLVDPLVVWAGVYPSKPRKVWKVIGGHQRLSVLKELAEKYGIEEVPVLPWFGSEEKALKLNLALNRIGGDWDYVALKDWFAKIEEKGDLELTGFTAEEISFVVKAEDGVLAELEQPSFTQLSVFEHPSLDVGGERTKGRTLETVELPVASVKRNKFNPSQMSDNRFTALKRNIEALGLLYPILVRATGENAYEIIDGEKRHAAFEALGRKTVPCIVTEMDDRDTVMASLTANRLRGGFKASQFGQLLATVVKEEGSEAVGKLLDIHHKEYTDPVNLEEAQSLDDFMATLSDTERSLILELTEAETRPFEDAPMIFMVPLTFEQHQFVVQKFEESGEEWGQYLVKLLEKHESNKMES